MEDDGKDSVLTSSLTSPQSILAAGPSCDLRNAASSPGMMTSEIMTSSSTIIKLEKRKSQVEELHRKHKEWVAKIDEEQEISHRYCMDEISRLQQQSKDTHAMLLQLKGILDQAKLDNKSKYYFK